MGTGVKEPPFAQVLANFVANLQLPFQEHLRSKGSRAKACLCVSRKGNITSKALSALQSKGERGQGQNVSFRDARRWEGGTVNDVTLLHINGEHLRATRHLINFPSDPGDPDVS